MMGHSHVVSGVAAGMALFGTAALSIPPLSAGGTVTTVPLGAGLGDLPLTHVVAASLIMGVTALLPDIDSPSSSAATALPGVTRPISRIIAKGGHRTWTHSLVGFAIAAFLTYDLTFWTVTVNGVDVRPGNGVVLGLLMAIAARGLGVPRSREGTLWALFLIGFVVGTWALGESSLWFMPALVAAGMWVHRIGDDMTTQSVHGLLYPLFKTHLADLPALLGDAGSGRERVLRGVMYVYCLYCFIYMVVTGR